VIVVDKNPIRSVRPADSSGTPLGAAVINLPPPSSYPWAKEDLSSPDAGRVESAKMLKKRIGRIVAINLEWKGMSLEDASLILQAFAAEYSLVEFLDAEAGTWITRLFYTGGSKGSLYSAELGLWESVGFNIIQSIPDPG
jgi:hypothetical protein